MSRRTIYVLVLGGAAVVAAALIGTSILLTRGSSSSPNAGPGDAAASVYGAAKVNRLLSGIPQHGIELGNPKAPVTLVEYADMQCPFCARFAVDEFPSIVRNYVRNGRVRVLFRGLAFVGPDSGTALDTALAAGSQERLWHVVELLYENQGAENTGWVSQHLLRAVGGAVPGLGVQAMLDGTTAAEVADARNQAQVAASMAGINSTPTFTVDRTGGGVPTVVDAQHVRAALDAALQG